MVILNGYKPPLGEVHRLPGPLGRRRAHPDRPILDYDIMYTI